MNRLPKCLLFFAYFILTACHSPRDFKKEGGVRYVLEMDPAEYSEAAKQECMRVLAKRINLMEVADVTLTNGEKPGQIIVEIPGKQDLQRIRKALLNSAKLAFYETYENEELYPQLAAMEDGFTLFELLHPALARDENTEEKPMPGPALGFSVEKDTAAVNALLRKQPVKEQFPMVKFLWTAWPDKLTHAFTLVGIRVNKRGEAALTGNIIKEARRETEPQNDRPIISITMNEDAAVKWAAITRNNVNKCIAIVIDDQVTSYPMVQSEIKGGACVISGDFTAAEVDDLVNVLRAGDLQFRLRIMSEEIVPPQK